MNTETLWTYEEVIAAMNAKKPYTGVRVRTSNHEPFRDFQVKDESGKIIESPSAK